MKNCQLKTATLGILFAIIFLAACQPTGKDEPDIRLYVLDGGRIDADLFPFAQENEYRGRKLLLADTAFLIRHPNGDLLWDTGIDEAIHDPESEAAQSRPNMSMPVTITQQLAQLGMKASDVEYLSLSHSHWDHLANANLFKSAIFLVDKDERSHMFSERARQNTAVFQTYHLLETAETIEFDGDYDVFGDGTVKILAMPGHTPGHTALLVNLPHEGPVLLSGDLYHLIEARTRRTVPRWNTDVDMTLASMERFEQLATELSAQVIIQHSLSTFEALPRIPDYLGNPDRKRVDLHRFYEGQVRALTEKEEHLRQQRLPAEAIARSMHAERRALDRDYTNRVGLEEQKRIYRQNVEAYRDKLGPSIEFLRKEGKSWEEIIEDASRFEW